MKNKLKKLLICIFSALFIMGALPSSAQETALNDAQSLLNGITAFKLKESGSKNVKDWINSSLSKNAGVTSEWYVLALSQSGEYDFSAYEKALLSYLTKNEIYSASSRQKYAIALIATGSCDAYIHNVLNNSIGKQGIMSWVYGLHLFNNGYSADAHSLFSIKQKILSFQLADGGFALTGTNGDIDVTAMTVQALAPHYESDTAVKSTVDKALAFLSARQQPSGDFASYGVSNPESTAQVITALSSLGIDCITDTRFIKNGNTMLKAILAYRLEDGSFCHKKGEGFNENATAQVYYSLTAYIRLHQNKGPFYILDARNPEGLIIPDTPDDSAPDTQSSATESSDNTDNSSSVSQNNNEKPQDSSKPQNATPTLPENTESSPEQISVEVDKENHSSNATNKPAPKKHGYKLWVSLVILALGVAALCLLFFTKKLNLKNLALVLAVLTAALLVVLFTDFQSVDSYYNDNSIPSADAVGTVTLSVRCDTLVGKTDAKHIPENGIIIEKEEFSIVKSDTVYDLLIRAAKKHKIQLESSDPASGNVYIKGMNNIYEFDFGDLSGWVYLVNGSTTSLACNEYSLTDGDVIEWHYSCELGSDIN